MDGGSGSALWAHPVELHLIAKVGAPAIGSTYDRHQAINCLAKHALVDRRPSLGSRHGWAAGWAGTGGVAKAALPGVEPAVRRARQDP